LYSSSGASDTPLTTEERQAVPGVVQLPETIGSVVVAYNLPGIPTKTLKFTGPVLADIFQGKITKWNDPQIKALNPGVNLPDANIVVVHRSDGSGTNYVWTSYLSTQRGACDDNFVSNQPPLEILLSKA
jgi:ABC-type phosphate transport system substrate-binding protein